MCYACMQQSVSRGNSRALVLFPCAAGCKARQGRLPLLRTRRLSLGLSGTMDVLHYKRQVVCVQYGTGACTPCDDNRLGKARPACRRTSVMGMGMGVVPASAVPRVSARIANRLICNGVRLAVLCTCDMTRWWVADGWVSRGHGAEGWPYTAGSLAASGTAGHVPDRLRPTAYGSLLCRNCLQREGVASWAMQVLLVC